MRSRLSVVFALPWLVVQGESHPARLALRERRERVIAQLSDCFARDALGLEEFEARINAAYRCQHEEELDALVADLLPDGQSKDLSLVAEASLLVEPAPVTSMARVPSHAVIRAVFSNIQRCDQSAMLEGTRIEAIFGNLELDLRQAPLPPGTTEIRVKAVFGSVEIVVPADINVEVQGGCVFGNFEGTSRAIADADAPTLRIIGVAVFASVVVKTLPPMRVHTMVEQFRSRRLLPP